MASLKNLSVASLGAVFLALGTTGAVQAATFYGEAKPLENGSVRSFVTLNGSSGKSLNLGVKLFKDVLPLPTDHNQPNTKIELSLLPKALATPFKEVGITYRPHNSTGVRTIYGEAKPLGNGSVRSFITIDDRSRKPLNLGVTLSKNVLPLPTDDNQSDIKFELSLPREASVTPFKEVEITYRPQNYTGVRTIFDAPRISTDFSLLTPQERDLICPNAQIIDRLPTCLGDEQAQALKTPEPGILPEGFEIGVVPEGRHGIRYFDGTAPLPVGEINGEQQLTSVYNYAIFNGNILTFLDIVTSNALLESEPNFTSPIRLPSVFSQSGYYPTEYSVTYDAPSQEYKVTLSKFTYRSATHVP